MKGRFHSLFTLRRCFFIFRFNLLSIQCHSFPACPLLLNVLQPFFSFRGLHLGHFHGTFELTAHVGIEAHSG